MNKADLIDLALILDKENKELREEKAKNSVPDSVLPFKAQSLVIKGKRVDLVTIDFDLKTKVARVSNVKEYPNLPSADFEFQKVHETKTVRQEDKSE